MEDRAVLREISNDLPSNVQVGTEVRTFEKREKCGCVFVQVCIPGVAIRPWVPEKSIEYLAA